MLDDDDVMRLIEQWLTIEDRCERVAEAARIFEIVDRKRHAMAAAAQSLEWIGIPSVPLESLPLWKSTNLGRFYGQNLRDLADDGASRAGIAFALKNLRTVTRSPEADCRSVAAIALKVWRASRNPCLTTS